MPCLRTRRSQFREGISRGLRMRFLANENFPGAVVVALADAGHDVVWIRTESPGSTDANVLAWAARDGRILLTFDKDFGELARRSSLPPACGVMLFRMPMPAAEHVGARILKMIESRSDWSGHFSVVEPARIRMRPLASRS